VFDLPDVVAAAGEVLGDLPADRCEAAGGDFFDPHTIPTDQDRYLMQAIMRNWSDDHAGAILRNVRNVLAPGSRRWVVGSIIEPGCNDDLAKATGMFMLVLTEGGRERTEEAWERLFRANGFRIESKSSFPCSPGLHTRSGRGRLTPARAVGSAAESAEHELLALLGSLAALVLGPAEELGELHVAVALGISDVGLQAQGVLEALLGEPDQVVVPVLGAGDVPGLGVRHAHRSLLCSRRSGLAASYPPGPPE
jgi:hypothetical protein